MRAMEAEVTAPDAAREREAEAEMREKAMFDGMITAELMGWHERVQDAVFYARAAAKGLGYALAVHGSLRRDIDVVAVPWTEEAAAPDVLAKAVLDMLVRVNIGLGWASGGEQGTAKPHGRHAWDIALAGQPFLYLDLSVMAPTAAVRASVLAEVERVVESEEELAGPMPAHINTALTMGPREAREEVLRAVVRTTKRDILARLAVLRDGGMTHG